MHPVPAAIEVLFQARPTGRAAPATLDGAAKPFSLADDPKPDAPSRPERGATSEYRRGSKETAADEADGTGQVVAVPPDTPLPAARVGDGEVEAPENGSLFALDAALEAPVGPPVDSQAAPTIAPRHPVLGPKALPPETEVGTGDLESGASFAVAIPSGEGRGAPPYESIEPGKSDKMRAFAAIGGAAGKAAGAASTESEFAEGAAPAVPRTAAPVPSAESGDGKPRQEALTDPKQDDPSAANAPATKVKADPSVRVVAVTTEAATQSSAFTDTAAKSASTLPPETSPAPQAVAPAENNGDPAPAAQPTSARAQVSLPDIASIEARDGTPDAPSASLDDERPAEPTSRLAAPKAATVTTDAPQTSAVAAYARTSGSRRAEVPDSDASSTAGKATDTAGQAHATRIEAAAPTIPAQQADATPQPPGTISFGVSDSLPDSSQNPALSGTASAPASPDRAAATSAPSQPPPTGTPPPLAQQLAETLRGHDSGRFEITLRPEELGRVRMSLHQGDVGLTVQISAERPETLDLIRRHLPEFGRDLRQLGHGSVAFSFAGQGGDRQPAPQTPHVRFGETAAEPRFTAPAAMPAPSRREGTSALDIRL